MAKRLTRDDFAKMLSFGTFKPVGYTVLAYPDEATARDVIDRLRTDGFGEEDVLLASSAQLFPKVAQQMPSAQGVVGAQGYEVVLMRRYLDIAGEGAWWLMVWSPDEGDVQRVKRAIVTPRPVSAAHYGRIMIEDLSEPPVGVSAA
jgi:hypothetical protein